jgi:hypothetical protein
VSFTTSAGGSPPPTALAATTGDATSVTAGGATLSGTITPGSTGAQYRFIYGVTTSYGLLTPVQTLPAGSSPVTVSAVIGDLGYDTTYHYELIAYDGVGRYVSGGDKTLHTLAPAARPRPGLTLAVRPKHDRHKPFRFRAHGRLELPSGVGAAACHGSVRIRLFKGKRVVASRKAKVKDTCGYSKKLTAHVHGHGKLKVRARFGGNAQLAPRRAKKRTVRYG